MEAKREQAVEAGAGIVGPKYCATCNQSLMWHEIAASIPDVELAEALRASGESRGGTL